MQQAILRRSAPPIVHINTFGAFLSYLRDRVQISQGELADSLPYFFEEYNIPYLTADMYRKVEKGKRAVQFEELLPLYAALIGNDFKLSPQDRSAYVRLARMKLEGLKRRRPKLKADSEWRALEVQLAQLDQQTTHEIHDIEHNKKRVQPGSLLDTNHIVGRDDWLSHMLTHLDTMTKKLVVIQGMMGIGKTTAIKLLLQQLLERENYHIILYTFSKAVDTAPTDHLDMFLATILTELQVSEPEAIKLLPLKKRIEQVITCLSEADQRVVLLVDDAQIILDAQGQLSSEWQLFFAEYLRANHRAIIYLATREWPLWTGRERSFVVDGDEALLTPIDNSAGVHIWGHLGFSDVSDDLLQQATARCGGNPLVIELRTAYLQRPRFSFNWQQGKRQQEKKSVHQQLIEQLLTDTQIFGTADREARQLLQHVIGGHLSHDALELLEALSASPIALPFPLLLEINSQAEYAFSELFQASLIDQNAIQNERAALQPLAREAIIHQLLTDKRLDSIEQQLIHVYTSWLEQGTFQSEQEQALLVSELAIIHLKQGHLLEAVELLIEYGWLSFTFGHGPRLARVADQIMHLFNWHQLIEHEVGGLLLQYHLLARALDKDLSNNDRKKAYLHLYDVMIIGSITLKPPTIAHLVHHKLRYLLAEKQFTEAKTLINELCKKYESFQMNRPTTYIELLDRRAYVLGRWGDYLEAQAKKEVEEIASKLYHEAFHLRKEAVIVHQQCADVLRQHERFASPIEQSRMRFKRARLLNDLSYYQRVTENFEAARQSMKECLQLKEAGFAVSSSLAVSYDDYGQLLSHFGQYQEALVYSERALQIMQKLVDAGQSSTLKEKGMLLINRGKLLSLVGKLDDAKEHLIEGTTLVEGTSREVSAATATECLRTIEQWEKVNFRHQLDWQWYPRYHALAAYSDIAWLTPAGTFSAEEQLEWESLMQHHNDEASKRMSELIVQSQKREIARSLEEQREPHFHYPLIPHTEVQSKLIDLERLHIEIELNEPNIIVRRLYTQTIEERMNELRLIAATGNQEDEAFRIYNQRLHAAPNMLEMELAVRQLTDTLRRGLQCNETEELSKSIIQQTRHWTIKPMHLEPAERASIHVTEQQRFVGEAQQLFPVEVVGRFFTDVFRAYQFPWTAKHDVTADHTRVSLDLQQLILPAGEELMSLAKVRELLCHEIEIHAFRSNAGEKSPIALLASGLQGFLETEEGLALYYTQEVSQQGFLYEPNKSWIGTLATGLAAGVICEPFTFRQLLLFLEAVNILRSLLSNGKKGLTQAKIQENARRSAQSRCLRTWRGVTNLTRSGICSTKDAVYLRGYLAVTKAMKENPTTFERLMVGALSLHHLNDVAELGLTKPVIAHQRLAADPELGKHISQYIEKAYQKA